MLIVDGHGQAHPHRFGLAYHLGVWLDLPAIGCVKSILIGKLAPLGAKVVSTAQLTLGTEVLGIALRTRTNVKPVYLSRGYRMDLMSVTEIRHFNIAQRGLYYFGLATCRNLLTNHQSRLILGVLERYCYASTRYRDGFHRHAFLTRACLLLISPWKEVIIDGLWDDRQA